MEIVKTYRTLNYKQMGVRGGKVECGELLKT